MFLNIRDVFEIILMVKEYGAKKFIYLVNVMLMYQVYIYININLDYTIS